MVQYLPGPEAILGPALGELAQSVGHLINPNREFQLRMQGALATNPGLIQQLADTEAQSPGALKALGLGPLADVISSVPESVGAKTARTNRGTIEQTANTQVQTAAGQAQLDAGRVAATIDFLKSPEGKTAQSDQILKLLTGETPTEKKLKTAEAARATTEANVAAAEAPGKIAKAQLDATAIDQAIKNMPLFAGKDFRQLARDFIGGKLDAATAQSLFLTPGASQALETAVRVQEQEEQRAFEKYLLSLRGDNKDDNFQTQKAYQMFTKTNAGTLEAWKTILFQGGAAQAQELLKKDPTKTTQAEKDLIAAYDANERELLDNRISQARNFATGVGQALGQVRTSIKNGESDTAIQLGLNDLQAILDTRAGTTGSRYQVHYKEAPSVGRKETRVPSIFLPKELYFTDETGTRVDESVVLAANLPSTRKGVQQADVMQAVGELSKYSAKENAAALAELKSKRPDIYDAVINLLPAKSKP